jgi:sodium/hydrogen antiporter
MILILCIAVGTIVGIVFGPIALNLFNPFTWGNTDQITLELSRIVLIVQVFAVGVELPKAYLWRHWKSLFLLLAPVMTYGWLVSSAFIYWLIPALNFVYSAPSCSDLKVDALCVGACVTATDPVLASSVVGKGKFARRVPGHLRNLLSAESGSNDGMAIPFLYLAVYIIQYKTGRSIKDWILIIVLYEVVMGTVLGAIIGIVWRKAIKFAERRFNILRSV